jgi:hypothetical protein
MSKWSIGLPLEGIESAQVHLKGMLIQLVNLIASIISDSVTREVCQLWAYLTVNGVLATFDETLFMRWIHGVYASLPLPIVEAWSDY